VKPIKPISRAFGLATQPLKFAAIAETEENAGLEAAGDGQQALGLVRAHHQRNLLRFRGCDKSRRQDPIAAASPRLDLTKSMSSPPETWVTRPASPLTVRTNPMFAGSHPRSARWTATKGPKPVRRPARKKFSQSSACKLVRCGRAVRVFTDSMSIQSPALCHLESLKLSNETGAFDRVRIHPWRQKRISMCIVG
jgi:hypothetical protein